MAAKHGKNTRAGKKRKAQHLGIRGMSLTVLTAAAKRGDPRAQHELANRLYVGEGVEQNAAQAVEWFEKAAKQGLAASQFNLATLLFSGNGTAADEVRAAAWFRAAAEQGMPDAEYNYGACCHEGRGVP